MVKKKTILLYITSAILACGCSDTDILETYEEVKEFVEPVPISFSPYIGTSQKESVTTRADLQFLSFYNNSNSLTKNIPFLGEGFLTSGTFDGYKQGHAAFNNYIVGVYGFYHQGSDWSSAKNTDNLQADYFTNQPVLHLWNQEVLNAPPYWTYSPLKYWPNNVNGGAKGYSEQTDKVTFISYYPYQDFVGGEYYKNGEGQSTTPRIPWTGVNNPLSDKGSKTMSDGVSYNTFHNDNLTLNNVDLRCITPPAKDATGSAAYTFGFQQKNDVTKQIDFMIGVNNDVTKQDIGESVTLRLRHTLSIILLVTSFNVEQEGSNGAWIEDAPSWVSWKINSITLTNMKDKGTVTPDVDSEGNVMFNWVLDDESRADYTVFNEDVKRPAYEATIDILPTYDPLKPISNSNKKYKATPSTNLSGKNVYDSDKNIGHRWTIIALPQTVSTSTNNYVDVDYDLSYTFNRDKSGNPLAEPQTVIYKNCKEHLKITKKADLSPGMAYEINLQFYLKGVHMDATMSDWDDIYYNVEEDTGVVDE